MLFDKQFLVDMEGRTIEDVITSNGRWSIHHKRIFEHEGKFYVTRYSCGATEMQDEQPYEYAEDQVECEEVIPVVKSVVVYEPVGTPIAIEK